MGFAWIALLISMGLSIQGGGAGMAEIEFHVRVPAGTDTGSGIFLSGNIKALGNWSADGFALKKLRDGIYDGKLRIPRGEVVEYKVTRGSWQDAEKGRDGGEIPNRRLVPDGDTRVHIVVLQWAGDWKESPGYPPGGRVGDNSKRPVQPSLTGDIRYHTHFSSCHLSNDRTLIVYLPPGYETGGELRYPVLYLHDGQNVFDASTSFLGVEWNADETAERLIRGGELPPIIIVGIYNNADRMNEYSTSRDNNRKAGGRGRLYARFVAEEVKPFIDQEYRTLAGRDHTAIAGSSMGGLISLYICSLYPDTFSMCGVISPALWWDNRRILKDIRARPEWVKKVRFWVDMGTNEGGQIKAFNEGLDNTRELVRLFESAGLSPVRDYHYWEVEGAGHNETFWAARFDKILLYFFGTD